MSHTVYTGLHHAIKIAHKENESYAEENIALATKKSNQPIWIITYVQTMRTLLLLMLQYVYSIESNGNMDNKI